MVARQDVPSLSSVLPGEEAAEGAAVGLAEGRVDERVEEGVGVAEPQEDALPGGRDVPGAEGADELGDEEGDPAEHEHPDEDAHHEGRLLLLLFPPRVPFCLEGDSGSADGERHVGLLPRVLPLQDTSRSSVKSPLSHLPDGPGPARCQWPGPAHPLRGKVLVWWGSLRPGGPDLGRGHVVTELGCSLASWRRWHSREHLPAQQRGQPCASLPQAPTCVEQTLGPPLLAAPLTSVGKFLQS